MRVFALYLAIGAVALSGGWAGVRPVSAETAARPDTTGPLTIENNGFTAGRAGSEFGAQILVKGGTAPYTYSASGLPAGLAISSTTGLISGIPEQSAVGMASVTVKVTDSTSPKAQTASVTLSLAVNLPASQEACGGLSLGANADLNGYVPFPANSPWNTDIYTAALDPDNDAITQAAGFVGLNLHHDFSSVAEGSYGIPYMVVDSSSQPVVPINVAQEPTGYPDQSDLSDAPFPINAPIEGAPADCAAGGWPFTYIGDAHTLVLDRNTCMLYETFNTHRCNGAWNASQESVWDLRTVETRPWSWTSADAAGLPILPGLLKYDEVASGHVDHAIRFTMQVTKNDDNGGYFVEPATHAAGVYYGVSNVMGMRIRLKSSFDISSYSKANQAILTAMQHYGMILADNGGYFYFQGAPDPRWDDSDLELLDQIPSSEFEVVKMDPVWPGWDSNTAPTGTAPKIESFTASETTVKVGTPVTFNWQTTNDNYDYIDSIGGVHGDTITVTPPYITTYHLNATNSYGRSTKGVTVYVTGTAPPITWLQPANINYGAALGAAELNAKAPIAGVYAYNPPAGTVLHAGAQTLKVTFTPTDITDYKVATAETLLTVNQLTPTVSWSALAPINQGTALSATQLDAKASLPGKFTYNPPAGTVLPPGTKTLSATFTPTDNVDYASATVGVNLTVVPTAAQTQCSAMKLGANASLNGYLPFPSSMGWNVNIADAPVDPNSDAITSAAGFAGGNLHPDFSNIVDGDYGIPYVVVDSTTTPLVPISIAPEPTGYPDQSDVALAPFPITAPIEGSPGDCAAGGYPYNYEGDAHVLVLDRATCMLYETFNTHRCNGKWAASEEVIWDMRTVEMRPWGWTSADAAGLSLLAGLLKYDEVASGEVRHAIRFTLQDTKDDDNNGYFVEPASHAAGTLWGVSNIMGMRIRLKAGFNVSGFSKTNQVILNAMKNYGMILADNGGDFFFQGAPDARWDDNDLDNLKNIGSENFEVVQMTPAFPGWDENSAPTGKVPTISSFTASATSVQPGTAVTLKWTTENDSFDFIDKLGGVHGGTVTVKPTATTTYTLNATNQFGRSTKAVKVTVE
jgi:hypothetical protein